MRTSWAPTTGTSISFSSRGEPIATRRTAFILEQPCHGAGTPSCRGEKPSHHHNGPAIAGAGRLQLSQTTKRPRSGASYLPELNEIFSRQLFHEALQLETQKR